MKWQPIETVPIDETMFIAYCPPDITFPRGRMMMWSGKAFAGSDKAPFHLQYPATHWMPLPQPPLAVKP
jgi:hypothetical protein